MLLWVILKLLKIGNYFDDLDNIASSHVASAVFHDLVHLFAGATNRRSMPTLLALKGLLIIVGESRKDYPARSSDQKSHIFDGLNNLLHFIISSGILGGKGSAFAPEHPTGNLDQESLDIVIIYILETANVSRPELYWYFCVWIIIRSYYVPKIGAWLSQTSC